MSSPDRSRIGTPPFPDRGSIDDALWRNVGTLAYCGVAKGYGDGTYGPLNQVLNIQVIRMGKGVASPCGRAGVRIVASP